MTKQDNGEISKAKLTIMEEVPYLRKTEGKDLPYTFASERDLIGKVRPRMVEHGVHLYPLDMELVGRYEVTSRTGKPMELVIIRACYKFTHISGEYETVAVLGEAMDTADKAVPKAMTIALKYAIRQWLLIETGDDPDAVVTHRGDPKSEMLTRAARGLDKARDMQRLDYVKKWIDDKCEFDEEQKAELDAIYHKKAGELEVPRRK